MKNKIRLYGFNNLTKTLSFNIYDICYAKTDQEKADYIQYIDEQYNSERLTKILCNVTEMIGARVLNIARQDYEPQGASVTLLISEEQMPLYVDHTSGVSMQKGEEVPVRRSVVGHLDKSHLTVHTYPESHPQNDISTFRVDIDVATCGEISPLNALNYLIDSFDSDVITVDYRVRGFTRDVTGYKCYIDHKINSIQNYIEDRTIKRYELIDVNVYQSNIFHTKMRIRDIDLDNYLFSGKSELLSDYEKRRIVQKLNKEMDEIYYGTNIT